MTFHSNPSWDPPQHHKVTMDAAFRPTACRRCRCSKVTLHDSSRAMMSEQVLVHLVGHAVRDLMRSPYQVGECLFAHHGL